MEIGVESGGGGEQRVLKCGITRWSGFSYRYGLEIKLSSGGEERMPTVKRERANAKNKEGRWE